MRAGTIFFRAEEQVTGIKRGGKFLLVWAIPVSFYSIFEEKTGGQYGSCGQIADKILSAEECKGGFTG